ncbi:MULTISPECIES: hypothetical protein [unclassified Neptuniibacter]|jgi:hypothetical protein|uniref:hypothetical protein n=1 Tax=unclassified Neptuniibacter TaxID=2630693 RepID=UPI0026E2FAB5|nr:MULTISPECIES: hypothetical protein [unclassified Neptuniibacter]MDO6515186.1 hypothetical protein [Neptuniibacter sp. 2_MG-2023]MDO6592224.1 hypothetical protein [Neptuniibacter sp. 1_MG-2023]
MNKLLSIFCCGITLLCSVANADTTQKQEEMTQNSPLLIKFQKAIFAEMIRTHGNEIHAEPTLNWCGLNELADELKLSDTGLKRAIYDSFVVSGTQNVQATEVARQMNDDDWKLYRFAMLSDIERYKAGIAQGLALALPTPESKKAFCSLAEKQALKAAQTISH